MTDKVVAGSHTSVFTDQSGIIFPSLWYGLNLAGPNEWNFPPWRGTGSISGAIDYNSSPHTDTVDLFDRVTNKYIVSVTADPTTGAFTFSGLSTSRLFDVRFRGDQFSPSPNENDKIIATVTPG